ncbi:malate synthase A [Polymorphobacter sp. PAMC 29334]|uniref:malate synthase A n=1 Tax=Polymorphobacter sp. PAMC 29334 TaxID=2862331 RepID=UPI001C781F18|nr:malate synthase A [Polymorphobacter sp. PAMC 29334]QYE35839.1 malate synthase A [Polymorphobacter sp. PAMC 29334]
MTQPSLAGIRITGAMKPGFESVLTDDALTFVANLHRQYEPTRAALLGARVARQRWWDAGNAIDFAPETSSVRAGTWKVAGSPPDLQDRRVEITGPVDRKMVINALNSGAKCFMADFEDASSPVWETMVEGQINLRDAVAGTITLEDKGKSYKLNDSIATLLVRPRGWHLPEAHMVVDGEPVAGALFDFGLYFFHNARALVAKGSGPYFYLPKLEHYLEARLWNNVFVTAQSVMGLPVGTIKGTVLIETLPGAFMADEILYELRDHIAALNCGRWDYIFSYIKCFRADSAHVLPDRAAVNMTVPFMRDYALHVIRTCHKRGAHAMGGMSAFIPVKGDEAANDKAFAAVRADKEREAGFGHDGTWVAHPGLVGVAMEVFDKAMPGPNQLDVIPEGVATQEALTTPAPGPKSLAGLTNNINVGIGYIASWLRGQGAAPLHNMMEDAATAEISRTQVWQWRTTETRLDSGELVDAALIERVITEQLDVWKAAVGDNFYTAGKFVEAAEVFRELALADDLEAFLTLPAYAHYFAA